MKTRLVTLGLCLGLTTVLWGQTLTGNLKTKAVQVWGKDQLGSQGWVNLDGSPVVSGTAGPFNGQAPGIPGTWYASNYDYDPGSFNFPQNGGGVNTYRSDAGAANLKANSDATTPNPWVLGNLAIGSYAVYTVNVSVPHLYDFLARLETSGGASVHLEADGVAQPAVAVASTGVWDLPASWATVHLGQVTLTAGSHKIKVVVDQQYLDLNTLSLSLATVPVPTPTPSATPAPTPVASNGQVTIGGYTYGSGRPAADSRIDPNGPLQVVKAGHKELWAAARTDGKGGSGTAADPYDVGSAAKYNGLLGSHNSGYTWHLAKGTYRVGSGRTAYPDFQLFGAGMDQTILASNSGNQCITEDYNQQSDNLQVFDLTIDCNPANNGGFGSALSVNGNHILVERVRAIHWGITSGAEDFVFFSFGNQVWKGVTWTDHVWDRCLFDAPLHNTNPDGVSIAGMFAAKDQGGFDKTCKITHCYAGPNIAQYFTYSHGFDAPEVSDCITDGVATGTYQEPENWQGSLIDDTDRLYARNLYKNCYQGFNFAFTNGGAQMVATYTFLNCTVDNRGYNGNYNTFGSIGYNYSSAPNPVQVNAVVLQGNTFLGKGGGSDVPLDFSPNNPLHISSLTIRDNKFTIGSGSQGTFRFNKGNVGTLLTSGNLMNGQPYNP